MRLFLFTSSFPYGKGEQFLETEINYLSEKFEEIIIIPTSYGGNHEKRVVPNNVKVIEPIINNKFSRIFNLRFLFVFNKNNFSIYIKEFFKSFKHSQVRLFLAAFNISYYAMRDNKIKNILEDLKNDDILYFYWGNNLSFILPFINDKKLKKVMRVHRGDLYEYLYNNYFPFRENQLKVLDYIVPISNDGKMYLEKKYPLYREKIKLYRLGTKYHSFLSPERKNDSQFRIVSCSSLIKEKRVNLIIEILSHIKEYDIEWVHFGDGPLKKELMQQIKNLPKNIKVKLKGFVPNKEVFEFYKKNNIDLFINVSSNEGVPVSIMEAISFGIPVMATDVGGNSEIVTNRTGVLLEKNFRLEDVAILIKKFINRDIIFNKKDIKDFWNENYNAAINYKKFANFLAEDKNIC